jgi:hypothetical protein
MFGRYFAGGGFLQETGLRNRALQRALFISSIALGAGGILSGAWMIVHGDPLYMAGLLGGIFPLAFGLIGLHKLRKSSAILTRSG